MDQTAARRPVRDVVDPAELRRQHTRSVRRVCPPWLADRSEDLVQNAVIRVLESRPRSAGEHPSGPPASDLWRVAYRATVDESRRVRRRQEVAMETPGSRIGGCPLVR